MTTGSLDAAISFALAAYSAELQTLGLVERGTVLVLVDIRSEWSVARATPEGADGDWVLDVPGFINMPTVINTKEKLLDALHIAQYVAYDLRTAFGWTGKHAHVKATVARDAAAAVEACNLV